MPLVDFRQLQVVVPVRDLLEHLGYADFLHEFGGLRCACPVHSHRPHRSRSFRLLKSGLWWCYYCHKGGDSLSLYRALHPALSAYQAAHELCAIFARDVPYLPGTGRRHGRNQREAM